MYLLAPLVAKLPGSLMACLAILLISALAAARFWIDPTGWQSLKTRAQIYRLNSRRGLFVTVTAFRYRLDNQVPTAYSVYPGTPDTNGR